MKADFAEIKRTTDLVVVVQGYGIELKREGKDWRGRCPFHADQKRPNLIVSPIKGLWRCPACNVAGNAIQFVARMDNLTEREAALKLLGKVPGVSRASAMPVKVETPVEVSEVTRSKLLGRVADFYAKTLRSGGPGLEYLKSRGLGEMAMLETFSVGYCNGSLRNVIPAEGQIVEQLKAIGVLNEKGNEVFYGRVVVPVYDAAGEVVSLYGRRLSEGEPRHLYLKGPRRGVFNAAAAKGHASLIVVEAIFDALSLWTNGFRNVIAQGGVDGWKEEHTALIRSSQVRELYIAFDNDEAGRTGAERLRALAAELPVSVYGIEWPEGVKDANAFFSSRTASDFEALLDAAKPKPEPSPETSPEAETDSQLGVIKLRPDGFSVVYDNESVTRCYELCAIEKPSPSRLKATVKALGNQPGRFVIDTLDFYMMRSKRGFISEAARLLGQPVEVIEVDVNDLTMKAEHYVQKRIEESQPGPVKISDAERAEGMRLGQHPDLFGEILRDLEALGLVGEEVNKLLLYAAMSSRKTSKPLSVQVLSGSGAGKSHLQDTVLSLCPEEDLIKVTALTDRALFYKGEDALRHKVLAIEEVAGAEGADYAIRNLISSGKLVIESTIKNPLTGRHETQTNTAKGPAAVFRTTTKPDTDAETKSRFVITSVDESAEQTRRILEAQRQSHTLEGMRRKHQCAAIEKRHHAFQRLLRPIPVVNPYEPLLAYGDDRLLYRRDNPKYQQLIIAVSFLHQLQRPVKQDAIIGEYIETTLDDVAIAQELAVALFGQSVDELSRPSMELLRLIHSMVEKLSADSQGDEVTFTRREVREFTGWSDYQIKIHIKQLEELEYLVPISGKRGQLFSYRLAWNGEESGFVRGFVSIEELQKRAKEVGLNSELVGSKTQLVGLFKKLEGSSRAQVGSTKKPTKAHKQKANGVPKQKKLGSAGEYIGDLHEADLFHGAALNGHAFGGGRR